MNAYMSRVSAPAWHALTAHPRVIHELTYNPVFPGGFLPSLTLLISTLTQATNGSLIVDSVTNIGPHYARTLREWRDRFEDTFESDIVPALRKAYPESMSSGDEKEEREAIEVFRRKWIYY